MAANTGQTIEHVAAAKAGKYLTFKLGVEEFGLEILKVQEIIKAGYPLDASDPHG